MRSPFLRNCQMTTISSKENISTDIQKSRLYCIGIEKRFDKLDSLWKYGYRIETSAILLIL